MNNVDFNEVVQPGQEVVDYKSEIPVEEFADCISERGSQSPRQRAASKRGLRRARSNGGGFDQQSRGQVQRTARKGGRATRRQSCDADTSNNSETKDAKD